MTKFNNLKGKRVKSNLKHTQSKLVKKRTTLKGRNTKKSDYHRGITRDAFLRVASLHSAFLRVASLRYAFLGVGSLRDAFLRVGSLRDASLRVAF